MLDFGHAVHRIVVGLTDNRPGHAELLAQPQSFVELFIGHAEGAFVSQENLEAADATLNDLPEIPLGLVVIGGWREKYRSLANNGEKDANGRRVRPGPAVDPGDVLPDGRIAQVGATEEATYRDRSSPYRPEHRE